MALKDLTFRAGRFVEDANGKVIPVVALANDDGSVDLGWGSTQFGETVVGERRSVVSLASVFGVSQVRDVTTETSGGTVSQGSGVYTLTSGATSGAVAALATAERAEYTPGSSIEHGCAVRVPTSTVPTGDQVIRWGAFDDNNGMYWGVDATSVFVGRRSGGSDAAVVRQSSWNVDTLDGSGDSGNPSGLTLTPNDGYVYRIRYAWYGFGGLEWAIMLPDANGRVRTYPVHRLKVAGEVSFQNPNLPVAVEVRNGTTASNSLVVYVGGRNTERIGGIEDVHARRTSQRALGKAVTTSPVAVASLRRKSSTARSSVKVSRVEIITDADVIWQVYVNATLTGASWITPTDHTSTETLLEADISATHSGGILIAQGLISGGLGAATARGVADLPEIDFVDTHPMTLVVRTVTGTGTISGLIEASERW